MTNLLPPKSLSDAWSMYRARFLIAGSLVVLVFAGVALLALVPSFLALRISAAPAPAQATSTPGSPQDAADILRAQALVRAVAPLAAAATSSDAVIAEALSLRPAGIRVTHIAFAIGTPGQMTISGTGSRDGISAYRDALGKDPYFTAVSVPVGALVGADNGQFSITISGTF